MRMRHLYLAGLVACTPSEGGDDAGVIDGGRNRPPCAVDRHNAEDQALALNLGQPYLAEAAICPPTDRDWYTFTLPGPSLVQIDVAYPSGATTPVELSYEVMRAGEIVVASAQDMIVGDNKSQLSRRHYLDMGGQYFLRVRDAGDDEQDLLNRYGVTVVATSDPDPNEPNDTCGTAQPLTMLAGGALTFPGDKDAFAFDVPSGVHIVDLTVTTTKASSVDVKASLYDTAGKYLTNTTDARGEDGATEVRVRYGLQSTGGRYCLVIEDDDGADSDPETRYQVVFQLVAEPDTNEQARRNDAPDEAIDLSAGGTRQGYIASTADLDWYRIDGHLREIAEITLSCPGCPIQPSISIVYGDSDSPCDSSSPCDYLLRPDGSCQVDADCESKVCREVPGGQKRCAKACGDRFECGSFQCQQVGAVSACVGAASCATGLCGTLQYTEVAGAMSGELRTAQPILRNSVWVLVRDFQDDQFAPAPYTLTVNIGPDPDRTNEPNNFYFPYTDADPGDILQRGRMSATRVQWSAPSMTGVRTVSGQGCIGYEGDIDIFRLEGGNPCGMGNCGLSLQYSRPNGRPELDLAWFLANQGLGTVSSFLSSGEMPDTTFGDAICGREMPECIFYRADSNGDYHLIVRDFNQDAWDLNPGQCYTWTLTSAPSSGCPTSCPMTGNDGICVCR